MPGTGPADDGAGHGNGDDGSSAGPVPPGAGCGAGFFGKLPMRGDFITRRLPRAVLRPFETWLEEVMAGYRGTQGDGWQAGFDIAPIWHFWIGPAVFGATCTGALMPSADRAGRRFPAVAMLADDPSGPDGESILCPPPPHVSPCREWHTACTALLRATADHTDMAAFETALAALPRPAPTDPALAALARDPRRALWAQAEPGGLEGLLDDTAGGDRLLAAAGRSYWWTGLPGDTPDEAAPPAALIALEGLPDARVFAFMLGGAGTARLANAPGCA